jgi:hypothetical protein
VRGVEDISQLELIGTAVLPRIRGL